MKKTTKKQFEIFKKECKRWITFFGLTEWRIYYYHEDIGDNFGERRADISAMNASIVLNTNFPDEEISKQDIKKTAFHEICELMLSEESACLQAILSQSEVSRINHTIIRRLENSVFKPNNTK